MSRNNRTFCCVDLTRSQAKLLEIAGRRLLADRIALPRGPERRSLETIVDKLSDERAAAAAVGKAPRRS